MRLGRNTNRGAPANPAGGTYEKRKNRQEAASLRNNLPSFHVFSLHFISKPALFAISYTHKNPVLVPN